MQLPLIAQDKANHITYGAAICAVAACFVAPWIALAIVAAIGAVKEVYDRSHPAHTSDPIDFAATVGGGLLVVLPLFIRGTT